MPLTATTWGSLSAPFARRTGGPAPSRPRVSDRFAGRYRLRVARRSAHGALAVCWLRRQNRGMNAAALVGRDAELGELRAFLDEVGDGPVGLVLSGVAGIGKTSLWRAGVEEGRARFGRVLTCRGVEAEASLSYAGLSDLLGEVLDEAAPSLATPRRRALEVALLLAEPGDGALDAHAVGLAVRDVLEVLSRGGSVLVAMDDVQWLDPSSAGVLQVAFRRFAPGAARGARDRPRCARCLAPAWIAGVAV